MQAWNRQFLVVLAVLAGALCATSDACDLLVRDAAFRTPRDVHRLCVMGAGGDPAVSSIFASLSSWAENDAADFNVEVEYVDIDDPAIEWTDYGIPSAPPAVPVVVLIGKNLELGRSFVIDHWEPAPTDAELAEILESPVRARLQEELGQHLAVVLFAPCTDCDRDVADAQMREIEERWRDRAELDVGVIEVDRTDPAEHLLFQFTGIPAEGPAWLGIVFGRGKLMNPPLIGDQISPAQTDALLEQVLAECSCSKPLPSMGVDLPLQWSAALDATVIATSTGELNPRYGEGTGNRAADDGPEYVAIPSGSATVVEDVSVTPLGTADDPVDIESTSFSSTTYGVLLVAVVAAAFGVWTFLRGRGGG